MPDSKSLEWTNKALEHCVMNFRRTSKDLGKECTEGFEELLEATFFGWFKAQFDGASTTPEDLWNFKKSFLVRNSKAFASFAVGYALAHDEELSEEAVAFALACIKEHACRTTRLRAERGGWCGA